MNQLSEHVYGAIKALQHCHTTCYVMAMTHCVEVGGEHARPQHLRLMLDCAALCAFTADAMGRKSQFYTQFAWLCGEVCATCADDCEKVGNMTACVEACRTCASICRELARPAHSEILAMASRLPPS
jgi:hypothetical protein